MASNLKPSEMSAIDQPQETGPWDAALGKLIEWDPAWAATCLKMTTNPWTSGVLPRKFIELVGVALNAACTNLNPDGTRRHIRAAIKAGATREEISDGNQMRVRFVDPFVQPGRADSARGSQGCGRDADPEACRSHAGLR